MSIYPKSFALGKRRISPATALVLMPFDPEFNAVYGYIKEFMSRLDITCNRSDDIYEPIPILSKIIEHILRSEFVIADLTTRNPNVFYEVGLAHSFRDSESVILITQSLEDIPFDIRHLPILVYKKENKYLLEEQLRNIVSVSRKKIGYKRFLLDYFVDADLSYSSVEKVIDTIRDRNPQFIENIYQLLSDEDDFKLREISAASVKSLIGELDSFSVLADGNSRKLLYKIKLDILVNTANVPALSQLCLSYLTPNDRDVFEASFNNELFFSTDFACRLIRDGLHKATAINWLLGYLKNSRVGGIDIIRNKVDEFLVKTPDNDVNSSLLTLLDAENFTLREAAVDILTQKKLSEAYLRITSILGIEQNVYVVRSMINGLARYENPSACEIVISWFRHHTEFIIQRKERFICDVGSDFFKKFHMYHYAEEVNRLTLNWT